MRMRVFYTTEPESSIPSIDPNCCMRGGVHLFSTRFFIPICALFFNMRHTIGLKKRSHKKSKQTGFSRVLKMRTQVALAFFTVNKNLVRKHEYESDHLLFLFWRSTMSMFFFCSTQERYTKK